MLVLSRKKLQTIIIGHGDSEHPQIAITVLEINKGFVKLGIEAPLSMPVHRVEVFQWIQEERLVARAS